jgi:hypothetical protein
VVSFLILRLFGPRRETATLRAGAVFKSSIARNFRGSDGTRFVGRPRSIHRPGPAVRGARFLEGAR